MSSNRDNTTRPESSSPSDRSPRRSPRDEQQSGSVSSWFSRTFIPSPPAGPRLRPSGSHTTRQRQQNLEQALRGQISLPTPLPRARQSPSSLPNRDGSPSTSIGSQREDLSFPTEAFVAPRPAPSPPSKNMVPNPTETFLAPRPAPSPLSRNLASSPPQRSRLPTYGGRPVQGPGSSGLASPSQVTPAVSPRQGTCIPPAAEVQVPPSRGSQKSGAARDKVPIRNVATPPVVVQPESITSTSSSSEQPIQQNRASCSLSPPRPTGFGTSPRSKIPTRALTPMRKREVEDIPASLVSYSSDSPPTIEKVTYSSVSDSYTAEISTREIQPLSQKQQQEPLHAAEFLVKSIPESSSMFCTASPVTGSSMSPVDSSPEVPQVDNIVHVPKARDHTSYELPSNLSVLFSGFSRRPSPNIGSSTRSSTPSRGGNTGAPDFASETPEQRGARHAANQSVYDRMSPVLRQARSGFEAVRDWVTENGGRMNKDNDNTQEFPQTEEVVKETPEKVIPTVEGSTFTTDISEFLISNLYDQSLHIESEDAISDSSIKKPTSELESIQAVASGATEISTLTNTSESNASIATSDVATSVSVVRRLRKKTSFFNLRAPEPMPANLRVTDDEFYHEIPTTLLDAITPVVNSFVGMGLLEGCLSDEEEEEEKGVQTEMVLDNTDNFKDKDLSFQAFPSDEQRFSYTQEDFLDDFDADATNLSYRASTHDNTEVPIDIGMSLEPSSPEEEEVETEQHALVQPASTTADIPFRTDADQVSGVHPLIAATYPWNPHFQGAEEEFGGPVTIIPPPTTADGYLNIQAYWSDGRPIPIVRHGDIDVENCYKVTEEEKVKVEGGEQKGQERSETLVSAPQSLKNASLKVIVVAFFQPVSFEETFDSSQDQANQGHA
ncbi:hypothetical protein TWF970_001310 [Orbilia oligospora]|uniref:Uncharacterized protein n=1 Tax=Orbilia oligospora TaxID=2813651 RepID=A0A7C8VAZ5_ORBOL|nr:hypothetical protein TWF970_001310 [Orbilia oligospora]